MASRNPDLRRVEYQIRDLSDEKLVATLAVAGERGLLNAWETELAQGLRSTWAWRGEISWKQRRTARRTLEKVAGRAHRERRLREAEELLR